MRIDKDLVAASATPLVLGILAEGESYGYAIGKRVHERSALADRLPVDAVGGSDDRAGIGVRLRSERGG